MATSASRAAQRHSPKRPVVQRTPVAKPRRPPTTIVPAATPAQLIHELASCLTDADILQVLYRNFQPRFGYDVILLTVLERDGWYRVLPIDSGVLQDSRRRPVSGSAFARQYANPQLTVLPAGSKTQQAGRGPGTGQRIRFVIWAPVEHQGQLIGAVVYQSHRSRRVPPAEISFLEEVHRRFGVLLANAALNELTRNQARRLEALNSVARAMASTLDESSVLKALHSTLSELLPVETVEMATLEDRESDTIRLLRIESDARPKAREVKLRAPAAANARKVLAEGRPVLVHHPASSLWVPIKEAGVVRGALGISCSRPYAYEDSTAAFLAPVADEVTLALRNARSYAAIETQRKRLEVVNAIGRRLASSLDRWSIMRTLREELGAVLNFDFFGLATIHQADEGPMADGYSWIDGNETVYTVPLAGSGPSREAYETGQPVLVRRSPWATRVEAQHPTRGLVEAGGAMVYVADAGRRGRVAARSIVWVPVRRGERVTALLSLQSYRAGVFTDWHVHLLQDVAAHVSLALANAEYFAAAQAERRRLEALHVLELGVAGSADEAQIANAVFTAAREYVSADNFLLVYLDPDGLLGGFGSEHGGPTQVLDPKPVERTVQFRRLQETGQTFAGHVPEEARRPGSGRPGTKDSRMPVDVVWVPVLQDNRG